ncbi:hypothetical protein [Cellulomonas chengniuliangii]|uniref:PH domain-containing protein n=1 Tax=Cellulomonas chengniuliangii TaxID=2968084 RepID=A0ABY5L2Z4_9CELL|nr:hypothetical protein [Cellulomonas chengniuliangii]MCC2308357.1 hypothetical protein [Cellulomonas chengniuliangii]UUI76739.1 hypothetical protein NP064_07630 [Cellulomonas chengniuliangii]
MRRIAFRPFHLGLRLMIGVGPAIVAVVIAATASSTAEWVAVGVAVVLLMVIVFATGAALYADERRVAVALAPFWRRTIRWEDVESVELRTVRPFEDFGGWGVKSSHRKQGVLISTGDDEVVEVATSDGRRYLVALGPEAASAHGDLLRLRGTGAV